MGYIVVPPGELERIVALSMQAEDPRGFDQENPINHGEKDLRYAVPINLQHDFSDNSRPTLAHRRAIFFPTENSKAEFIWLQVEGAASKYLLSQVITPARGFEGRDNYTITSIGRNLNARNTLVLIHPKSRNMDINGSIAALAPGRLFPFTGPYIILAASRNNRQDGAQAGEGDSDITIRDVGMHDFHQTAHLFRNFELNTCIPNPAQFAKPCIPALLISDILDRISLELGIEESIDSVMVPQQTLTELFPLAFPHRFGLRWYLRTVSQPLHIRSQVCDNSGARWFEFTVSVNRRVNELGVVEESLDYEKKHIYSSVLIIQADGTPIDVHHITAFNNFMDQSLPLGLAVKPERDTIPTKSRFQSYWTKYVNIHRYAVADPWEFDSMIPEKAKANLLDPNATELAMKVYLDRDFWSVIVRKSNV